jgi:hypothetical protein
MKLSATLALLFVSLCVGFEAWDNSQECLCVCECNVLEFGHCSAWFSALHVSVTCRFTTQCCSSFGGLA